MPFSWASFSLKDFNFDPKIANNCVSMTPETESICVLITPATESICVSMSPETESICVSMSPETESIFVSITPETDSISLDRDNKVHTTTLCHGAPAPARKHQCRQPRAQESDDYPEGAHYFLEYQIFKRDPENYHGCFEIEFISPLHLAYISPISPRAHE